ncbi:MAG: sensor histidine kinase, partial [Gammaproteobacteria bacterium]
MFRARLSGLEKRRLRMWLALFFIALAVPTGVLIQQAYSRLKWEAFHQHRMLAEELAARINARYNELIRLEETRGFADYAFLNVAGDPTANLM